MNFEKLGEKLWAARGTNFVATLQFQPVSYLNSKSISERQYDIEGWCFVVRELNCVHEKIIGVFIERNREENWIFTFDSKNGIYSKTVKDVISLSIDEKLWDSIASIIPRAEYLLDKLGYV